MNAMLLMLALGADAEVTKLDALLVVKDLQGGFAGFTGKVWTVEKDGKWTLANQGPRGVLKVEKEGKLEAKELAALATAVKKFGAASLKTEGKPKTNPRTVTITYGKHTATLNLGTTGDLPKSDEKDMGGRFAGIIEALREAIPKAK